MINIELKTWNNLCTSLRSPFCPCPHPIDDSCVSIRKPFETSQATQPLLVLRQMNREVNLPLWKRWRYFGTSFDWIVLDMQGKEKGKKSLMILVFFLTLKHCEAAIRMARRLLEKSELMECKYNSVLPVCHLVLNPLYCIPRPALYWPPNPRILSVWHRSWPPNCSHHVLRLWG